MWLLSDDRVYVEDFFPTPIHVATIVESAAESLEGQAA